MKSQKKQSDKFMNDEVLEKLVTWLRNNSKLDTYSGVYQGRRIDFFRGDEFVDALCSKKCTKKKFYPEPLTRTDAIDIGNILLKTQFFHKNGNPLAKSPPFHQSTQLNKPKKTDDDAIKIKPHETTNIMLDEDEAVYTWMMPASHTRVYIMSALFLVAALFLCMFKVWPLILKIFVWWCSLILLITMTTLFIIRLIFAALFWVIGFKGLWLLPNLFNEEIDTLDTFTPLIGYGIDSKKGRKEARRKAKEEREREKAKKKSKKKTKESKQQDVEEKKPEPKETVVEGRFSDCNFGLVNMLMIGIIAIICCNYLGLFMPDNIPDFIVTQNELWKRFPGLAPPNATQPNINETVQPETPVPDQVDKENEEVVNKFINEVDEEEEIADDLDEIIDQEIRKKDDDDDNEKSAPGKKDGGDEKGGEKKSEL